ncbi:conjugal transfer protein TraN [Photobacterium damselae]|uniref:conjugal transfer protein TraN n=1 Tax=Photobacterium damselae TaxID=38293 RepID=UPI0040693F77
MTKTMLYLDGLTAELGLIGDYSGVWLPAKEYVTGLMDDMALKISETFFSSAADTAAGVAGEAGSSVTMAALKQSAMKFTNEFMIEQFGAEVASMFFQSATTAGGDVALSAGMQTAATAFMVVYYAYLAYVVVNLVVGIVWECTDDEINLAMKAELLSTTKIGTWCHDEVLGLCVEKRTSHCVYNSPVSRNNDGANKPSTTNDSIRIWVR